MASVSKEGVHYVFLTRIYAKNTVTDVFCVNCEILGTCLVLAWLGGLKKQQRFFKYPAPD